MSTTRRVGALRRTQAAFSIIELMIVLTIIGVLAAYAVPSFNKLIKDNRRATVVNELLANVMLARAEAAKRGQPVTLCGNTSGGGLSCTGGGTWDYGWMVFVDVNGNGAVENNAVVNGVTYDETAMVLRQYKSDYVSSIQVRSNTSGSTSGHVVVQSYNQAGTAASLLVCDQRGKTKPREARVVCVGNNGRAGSQDSKCSDNTDLVCP